MQKPEETKAQTQNPKARNKATTSTENIITPMRGGRNSIQNNRTAASTPWYCCYSSLAVLEYCVQYCSTVLHRDVLTFLPSALSVQQELEDLANDKTTILYYSRSTIPGLLCIRTFLPSALSVR